MAVKKLASPQSLEQANHDFQQLTRERTELQTFLRQLRLSAQDDLAVLKSQLGNRIKSGEIPQERDPAGSHRRLYYLGPAGIAARSTA